MASKLYVIMGATGHIGHVVAQYLLKRGHRVKVLGRDPKKLSYLKLQGADVIATGDFDKLPVLLDAFKTSDAVFSFIPPGYSEEDLGAYQDRVGEAIRTAIQKKKVPYVLNLSSIGADNAEGNGPIKGLHRQEQRLNTLPGVGVMHLRPAFFMENLEHSLPLLKKSGVFGSAIRADLPIPMIASYDIGVKAGEFLDRLDIRGHNAFEIVGPRNVTYSEIAKILGNVIGKPDLTYVQFSYEEAEKSMLAAGMKPITAALMLEMYRAFNEGHVQPTQKVNSLDHQGKTTIEQFAETLAKAYKKIV